MSAQILTTKLQAPPVRADVVARDRLLERLDEGARRRLTLLSAPAGFGKTTVVTAWLVARDRRAAWVSLDGADSDLARFLAHLVRALQSVVPEVGEGVLAALGAPGLPPAERLLSELANELDVAAQDVLIVLEDYHEIDSEAVDAALAFLLERFPACAHLLITTRQDPDQRLGRLRARDQLTEVRATDLRFTPAEAAAFLNGVMRLELTEGQVEALEARTEGWIAGLQLAALSLRGRDDPAAFVAAFAGDHRFIVDYLVDEVLRRQPERIRTFLLETSILDRLCAELCDAVVGGSGSAALLAELERANLFLLPLDDGRRWYRYHALFAEVLRTHLRHERAAEVPALHVRASAWHERHGATREAVEHALAAEDMGRVARLLVGAWRSMDSTFQSAAWLEWVRRLPDAAIEADPLLGAGHAWALLNAGELEAAAGRLEQVEGRVGEQAAAGEAGAAEEFPSLAGTIASARAYHALAVGEPGASVAHARRALEAFPPDDAIGRGVPLGVLALAHWANGDLDEAYDMLEASMTGFREAGNVVAAISGTFGQADIRLAQGRLRAAERLYQDAFALLAATGTPPVPGVAELHVGLAEVRRELGDLEGAERHLRDARELGERAVLPGDEARLRAAVAGVEAGLGRAGRAFELLDQAERLRVRTPMPELRPLSALRARIWIEQGRFPEARAWAQERALAIDDAPTFLGEFEHLVYARLLLADDPGEGEAPAERALALLARLLPAAESGGRTGSVIAILVLQALALRARGSADAALEPLDRALRLAAPEGYVRVFLDEGEPMEALLRACVRHGEGRDYARTLLEVAQVSPARPSATHAPVGPAGAAASALGPIEALTQREAAVLRYLASDLTGPDIARHMDVSINTVRTHTKSIYSKLDVRTRRAAVRRARELELL